MARLARAASLAAFLALARGVPVVASVGGTDEIKVLTTGILKGAFPLIAAPFERDTGYRVTMSWGPSSGTSPEASQVRIRGGEHVDVLIMVGTGMDELVRDGAFVPLNRRDVVVSRIGVAVKEGATLSDISTPAALRTTLLDAKSIGYSEGASGSYVANVLLPKLGIADQVAAKSQVVLGRKFVGEAIANGEIEIGVQQISELLLERGITVVGPLPAELQKLSVVSGAVSSRARNLEAARCFLDYLSSPLATDAMKQSGLDLPDGIAGRLRFEDRIP